MSAPLARESYPVEDRRGLARLDEPDDGWRARLASWMYGLLSPGLGLFLVLPPEAAWTWTGILHAAFGALLGAGLARQDCSKGEVHSLTWRDARLDHPARQSTGGLKKLHIVEQLQGLQRSVVPLPTEAGLFSIRGIEVF